MFRDSYMCWPVLYPHITGGAVLPGDVVVKVSYRQSPKILLICEFVNHPVHAGLLFMKMPRNNLNLNESSKPINGPSVVVQVGEEEEPPQVNGGDSSSVSKSSL